MEEGGRGSATVFAYADGELYEIEFDLDWRDTGSNRYELEMECDGNCRSLDFTMECDLSDDDMKCSGDEAWSDFDFKWERLE